MSTTYEEPLKPVGMSASVRATDDATGRWNMTPAVKWWAMLGGLVVAFVAYVLIKWVTGPYFKSVPQGPTHVPAWMHLELTAWQIASWPAALFLLYWLVVRPWIRDRSVGVDGILLIGFSVMWFQDPLSSAGNHWFVYNSSMVNM